ncbi:MAG: DUF541 domain-containing protein [Alphaproteobacteria bacterium]|nr:MAG: DUF541 domain-containing protein [Alphaproteobacteria bacterium]
MKYIPALMVTIGLLASNPANAFTMQKSGDELIRTVAVQGSCRRELVPDKASLNMTAVATNAKDLKSAVNEAVRNYESARTQIQKMKLKDAELTTSEYNVQPVYDWNDGKQILRGYQARVGLRVETSEIDRMGDVMAVAADTNMKDVAAWQLVVSPEKYRLMAQECLSDAVLDARKNAEKMAGALGGKVGNVLSLSQQGMVQQPPMPMYNMMRAEAKADMAQAPTIEAGKQDINITVDATFALQ